MRFAIFVHDPDDDMGYGRIVGPFYDAHAADKRANEINAMADNEDIAIETIVLPIVPSSTSNKRIRDAIRSYDDMSSEETYRIVRFCFNENDPEHRMVIKTGLTLEEAQEHCQREDTHGEGWFDGYQPE